MGTEWHEEDGDYKPPSVGWVVALLIASLLFMIGGMVFSGSS